MSISNYKDHLLTDTPKVIEKVEEIISFPLVFFIKKPHEFHLVLQESNVLSQKVY